VELTHFINFPWPQLQEGLPILTFCFLLKRDRRTMFLMYTLLLVVDIRKDYLVSSKIS